MRKLLLAMTLILAGTAFAQVPRTANTYTQNDIYFGYVYTLNTWSPVNDTSYFRTNGGEIGLSHNVTRHFAVLGQFEYHKVNDGDSWQRYTGGARYNFRVNKFRPFMKGTVGGARYSGTVASGVSDQSGYTWGVGGGVEYVFSTHWGLYGEGSYIRVPFGHPMDHDYFRPLAFGFAYHF